MRLIRLLGLVVIILLFVTFFMINRIVPIPNLLNQIRPTTLAEAQRAYQVFMPLLLFSRVTVSPCWTVSVRGEGLLPSQC